MNQLIKYIIVAAFIFAGTAKAQFTISINIVNPTPAYLSDFAYPRSGMATIIYNPADKLPVIVKFRTQLKNSDDAIIAVSNDANAATHTVNPGGNNFTLDKLFQIENLMITAPDVRNSLMNTGKLPSGKYQLCIQLINTKGAELMKSPVCRQFMQPVYQLPYLLSPNDKMWLDANVAQSVITFRWSHIVPIPPERVHYRLQVFEVLENQQPVQALRSNQPILNVELMNTTQYFWRPQLSLKDSLGHVFIWTIQSLDSKGFPVQTADPYIQGRSEPRVFGVCSGSAENLINGCGSGRKL